MNLGEATAIFRNIHNSERTDEEKKLSIRTVLDMDTHNGIPKQEFINALGWLLNHSIGSGMTGDLISRRELKKSIYNFVEQHRDDEIAWTGFDCLLKEDSVIGIIDSQLASYDVEKVVEQLEEFKRIMESPVKQDCYGEECEFVDCVVCALDKAIKTVKAGGANG